MSSNPDRVWKSGSVLYSSCPDRDVMGQVAEYIRADLVAEKDAEIERLKAENLDLTVEVSDLGLLHHSDQKEIERLKAVAEHRFSQGYVCACATLQRSHGLDTIAEELLDCVGPDWSQIDEYDREVFAAYLRERDAKEGAV